VGIDSDEKKMHSVMLRLMQARKQSQRHETR
jgi:hypothetical protein